MKRLLALALIAPALAHADVVATSPNTGGGQIVLTDEPGKCQPGTKAMFARIPGGSAIFGCWAYNDGFVFVKYTDGDVRIYNADNFVIAPKYNKPKGAAL